MANTDLALSYATLILVDAKKDLSAANLEALVTKAGVKLPQGTSASFAKILKGKDVSCWFSVSGGASGSGTTQASTDTKKTDVKKEDKKEAPPPVAEPEEDVDMGGLFDF